MSRNYKTSFVDENGYPVRAKEVTGFVHVCGVEVLTYCIGCMKDIKKGEKYIDFYSSLMGKERCHLKCYDFGTEGHWLGIKKRWKRTWIVKLFTNENTQELVVN